MSQNRYVLRHAAILLPFALAACGGGSGGGSAGLPTPDPLAPEQPATNFTSAADFDPCILASDGNTYCNFGLGQIGAADVYAKGAYGDGVVVAVIDSGIDTAHVELDSKISSASTDIAATARHLTMNLGTAPWLRGLSRQNETTSEHMAWLSVRLSSRFAPTTAIWTARVPVRSRSWM